MALENIRDLLIEQNIDESYIRQAIDNIYAKNSNTIERLKLDFGF